MLERSLAFLDRLSRLPYWQLALLILLAAAAGLGGFLLLRPMPRPQSVIQTAAEEPAMEAVELTVHVTGAVADPGVYRLQEGDRVVDALEEAGGPLPEADLESLNLAQPVQDGQKITVYRVGENPPDVQRGGAGTKVNINTAAAKELEELPGIGPTLAERIISYRERNGGFASIEEIMQVAGIGAKKFEEIRELVEI